MPIGVPVARYRRTTIAIKQETTYGVDAIAGQPAVADVIPVIDPSFDPNFESTENLSMAGDIGRLPSIPGLESGEVSFSMWWRGLAVAFDDAPTPVVPESHRALLAAGHLATFSSANGAAWNIITYTPDDPSPVTIYCQHEIQGQASAPTDILVGAVGDVEFRLTAGGVCVMTFRFRGAYVGRSDVLFRAGTAAGVQYPVAVDADFRIGSANYQPSIAAVSLAVNNAVQRKTDISAANGTRGFFIGDRRPVITIDPEADLVANRDWITALRAGGVEAMSWNVRGRASAFNRLKFNFPKAMTLSQGMSQRDQLSAWPTTLMATLTSSKDDFSLVVS